tara:strand:- start:112 stop:513 length:402 start_codon:yes stop_codon:yes gene_type:complete
MKQQPSKKDILGWTKLLEVAARTERRLPKAIKKQKLTSWVDYKTNPHENYGYEKATYRLPPPPPEDIDIFEKVLVWFTYLDKDERQILWARAYRLKWIGIAKRFGCNRNTARTRWLKALFHLIEIVEKNRGQY